MENTIQLKFKLDSLDKIGFGAVNCDEAYLKTLLSLEQDGILINSNHLDELCKSTISNGHNLLKSNGIFNIDTTVVGSMSKIIGQYLFRLLFGSSFFYEYLHKINKEKKHLDILLEFDPQEKREDSKFLCGLPWELMYCPAVKDPDAPDEDELQDGFFVSQIASIYRKYKSIQGSDSYNKGGICVSVAFLTKNPENLLEVCRKLKEISDRIAATNSNIRFEFKNIKADESFDMLSKEDLGNIFLNNKNADPNVPKENKIVHLIADVSTTEYNQKTSKSLYFGKSDEGTEAVSYAQIFQELFNKGVFGDDSLKLLVLQAWKDENKYDYSGFEEMATKFIQKNKTIILSMPYLLKQGKTDDGKLVFFEKLYADLANSLSIIETVKHLREDIFPKYTYGFPLLYLNGGDQILVNKPAIGQDASKAVEDPIFEEYKNLKTEDLQKQQSELEDKLAFFARESTMTIEAKAKYSIAKDIEDCNKRIAVIKMLIKKRM